ncbi:MAG: RDD family protein [Streptosporangiaceae bacterium]
MTQDSETGRDRSVPESCVRAEPGPPSPYLQAGEAIPEAYLAPPRPDQPRYGSAPPLRPGQRPFRPAPQPGAGQPRYGQPGYGRPAPARAGRSQVPGRRDPAVAAPWERAIASILDWTIILGVSIAIFLAPLVRLVRQMQAILTQYQGQNPFAAQTAINNLGRDPSTLNTIFHMELAAFGIALAYYWIGHAAWGTTLGKQAVGLRVVTASDHSRISVGTAGIRAVTFLVGPAAFLLTGVPFNVVGGAAWLADALVALADPQARSLHDRLAGTVVVRKRVLDQQRRTTSGW